MGLKRIVIIGGGISGLAALHYLKERFKDAADIVLYERSAELGGSIQTIEKNACLFETGPDGFLANAPQTLELLKELDLSDQLITADQKSARRYIQLNGRLLRLPTGPFSFMQTPLLSLSGKGQMLRGLFNSKISKDQSIHDYVCQRFGVEVALRLWDPFIKGIWGGDTTRLHMASCFPGEFKAKAPLMSLKKGMGSLIARLRERYQDNIKTGVEINRIDDSEADHIICAVPAYAAASMLDLDLFNQIQYAPVAVLGLVFDKRDLSRPPDGFGYVVPSGEGKDVLGVLLESQVFTGRAPHGQLLMRVMMGGTHQTAIINDDPEMLLAKALKEINQIYGLKNKPVQTFVRIWPKAIPQYDLRYPLLLQSITKALASRPNIHLCANYLRGVSLNDRINHAKAIADSI